MGLGRSLCVVLVGECVVLVGECESKVGSV